MPGGWTEALGYLASFFIVVSLSMRSVVKLRVASLIGGTAYTAYGALIGSWPVIVTNAIVVCLNIWRLRGEFAGEKNLGAVPMDPGAPFLADFLRSHLRDIHETQPAYDDPSRGDTAFVLMRDGMPAGAVVGARDGDRLEVLLDYVLPDYRDSRLGHWFYGRDSSPLPGLGITELTARPSTDTHRGYLQRVGFAADGAGGDAGTSGSDATVMRRSLA